MALSPWLAIDAGTPPAKRARELRDAWEDFVDDTGAHEPVEDPGTPQIRQPIFDSWQRSRDAGVDPIGRGAAPSVAELDDARAMWCDHPLAGAETLISHCMAGASLDADHLMVVSDADGVLLRIVGDTQLRNRAADDMNFVEGALWSESGAGTNAVGTALAAEHAVQVFAAEHFTESVQRWTCAAAPVFDPDTGEPLGVLDLTGDINSVNPHSLSVVVATARAVEELLRGKLRARDDRLRDRYGALVAAAADDALILASGRALLDPSRLGSPPAPRHSPPAADGSRCPTAPRSSPTRSRRTSTSCGRASPAAAPPATARAAHPARAAGDRSRRRAGEAAPAPRRAAHAARAAQGPHDRRHAVQELYGDEGQAASIRVEMSRLRRLLPGAIDPGYALTCDVDSDLKRVRALLGANRIADAAAAYPGPLLPASKAPGIERARTDLERWLRHAVIFSDDAESLWSWVQTASGETDLVAWRRLLAALDFDDGRRSLAAARTAALRETEGV